MWIWVVSMLKKKASFSSPATFDLTSDTRCVGSPPPQSSDKCWVSYGISVLTLSAWRWDGSCRLRAPYRTGLTSDPAWESRLSRGYRLGVPSSPLLGFHNLLEQLSELWKAASLLDYEFVIKGYNLWKRRTGRGVGKGWGASMPPPDHHPHSISKCSPTWKVSEPSLVGFLWRPKHDWSNHWLLMANSAPAPHPFPCLAKWGEGGVESSHPPISLLVLLATSPHPGSHLGAPRPQFSC